MTIAHQLRALPGFRWAPGMLLFVDRDGLAHRYWRVIDVGPTGVSLAPDSMKDPPGSDEPAANKRIWPIRHSALANCIPVLADAATGGILWVLADRPDLVVDGNVVGALLHDFAAVDGDGEYPGPTIGTGPTLGDACAALMVARGRCG